jgi:hypothetical protein
VPTEKKPEQPIIPRLPRSLVAGSRPMSSTARTSPSGCSKKGTSS